MSRSHGKHTPREPRVTAESPEGRQLGIGEKYDHPLPGGRIHLENPPAHHEKPAVPGPQERGDEFGGILAHGVPPGGDGTFDREDMPGHHRGHYKPAYKKMPAPPIPVPVYIVEEAAGREPLKIVVTDVITVPAAGIPEPVRLANIDRRRIHVRLLNETAAGAKGTRFGSLSDVSVGKGALLPPAMGSYITLETHDELFALSADATANTVSVILETEDAGS